MMSVEKLMRLLLELDQQVVSPRPSMFGEGAALVKRLARRLAVIDPDFVASNPKTFDGWKTVDLSQVDEFHPPTPLNQPILHEIDDQHPEHEAN